jgi:hypothetical protein
MGFEGRDRQDTLRYLSGTIYTKLDELTLYTFGTFDNETGGVVLLNKYTRLPNLDKSLTRLYSV